MRELTADEIGAVSGGDWWSDLVNFITEYVAELMLNGNNWEINDYAQNHSPSSDPASMTFDPGSIDVAYMTGSQTTYVDWRNGIENFDDPNANWTTYEDTNNDGLIDYRVDHSGIVTATTMPDGTTYYGVAG